MVYEEKIANNVGADKLSIAYEVIGKVDDPVIILIQGVGAQLVGWPDGFCDLLSEKSFQVVRFDNRDVGKSSHLDKAPNPDLPAALGGDLSSVSYTLSDMASDVVGLLDSLGVEKAHIVGASMGGAIAQTMALENPKRVKTLITMMSTTGNMSVGQPTPETLKSVFGGKPPTTRQEFIDQQVNASSIVGSPKYPVSPKDVAERAGRSYDRGYNLKGIARQAVASVASGDRTDLLKHLKTPTLVIHGLNDTMCDISGGRAVASAIAHSKLLEIEGMGHNLPPELWSPLVEAISDFIAAN